MKFLNTLVIVWSLYFTQIGVTYAVDRSANQSSGVRETNGEGESLVKNETYLSMLVMLAVGFSTAGLLRSCKQIAWDTGLGGIGGLAYTAGEVMAMMKYKEYDIDRKTLYALSYKKLDASAREEIEKQKEMYENTLKILELKYKMQLAAAAAWGAASLAAVVEWKLLRDAYNSCSDLKGNTERSCGTLSLLCDQPECGAAGAKIKEARANMDYNILKLEKSPEPSATQCTSLYAMDTDLTATMSAAASVTPKCIAACQAQEVASKTNPVLASKLAAQDAVSTATYNSMVAMEQARLATKAAKEEGFNGFQIDLALFATPGSTLFLAQQASEKSAQFKTEYVAAQSKLSAATTEYNSVHGSASAKAALCAKDAGLMNAACSYFLSKGTLTRSCCNPIPPPVAQAMPFDREFLKDKGVDFFEDKFAIGYNPQDTQKNAIETYIDYRDTMSMRDGATHSMSIGEYKTLKNIINPQNSEMEQFYKYTLAGYMKAGAKFILPEANAFEMMSPTTWGIASAALIILTTMIFTSWQWLDQMMAGPGRRAIVWGTLSAFSFATAKLFTEKAMDKMVKNIESLDAILKQMDRMAKGAIKVSDKMKLTTTGLGNFAAKNIVLDTGGKGGASGKCLFPQNSGGKCPDANSVLSDRGGSMGLAGLPSISSVSANAAKFANDFQKNGTLTNAGLNAAAGMGNNLGAIRKKLDEVEKSMAQASGGKFDLAKVQNNFLKGLLDKQRDTLKRKNLDAGALATAFGTSNLPPSDIKPEDLADTAKKDLQMVNGTSTGPAPTESMNINVAGDSAQEVVAAAPETSQPSGPNLDGFKLKSEDLIKNADVPIWQALSMRYLKTGYPLLLEEKPVETSAPKP